MPIDVIHLRGTKEPFPGPNISNLFLDRLEGRFTRNVIDYPADYGAPTAFRDSNAVGRLHAIDLITETTNPFVLSGYSAGAFVAGDLANEIIADAIPGIWPERLLACVLVADPKRPQGAGAPGLPTPSGYGIAGQRPVPGVRTWWGTALGDGISALGEDNPLRSAADLSKAFSVDPRLWDEWVDDMLRTLILRQIQPWWKFWLRPGRWGDAILALNGYLFAGAHTESYAREGICVALADLVNREVFEPPVAS